MQIRCKRERSHWKWSEYELMNPVWSPPPKQGLERGPEINSLIATYPGAVSPRSPGFSGKWCLEVMVFGGRSAQRCWSGYCFLGRCFYFSSVLSVFLKFYSVHWHTRYWAHWVTWKLSHLVLLDTGLCYELEKLKSVIFSWSSEIIWYWKRISILYLSFNSNNNTWFI